MLQKVLISKDDMIIYRREFGKSMGEEELKLLLMKLKKEANLDHSKNLGNYISFQNRLSYIFERDFNLFFIFISSLGDEAEDLEIELKELRNEFLNIFGEVITNTIDSSLLELINPIVDKIFINLRPKISLIGFSGVGKTTISKLIREEEIPTVHVPTITGKRSVIKIGKLQFILWDFAGQEQFSFLWNNFIQGSDAALLITDSTLENVEKSKFFIELIHEEAPYANSAIIANKQDLPGALKPEELEKILGLKAYSMVAIDPKNREKMIRIISEILEISTDESPLLRPIYERDLLILDAQNAYKRGNYDNALCYFEKIANICLELGDDSLGKEYYEKAKNLRIKLSENSFPSTQVYEIPEESKMPEITEPTPLPTQVSEIPEELKMPEITEPIPPPIQVSDIPEEPKMPEITKPTPPLTQVSDIPEEPKMPEITKPTPPLTQVSEIPEVLFAPEVLKNTEPIHISHEKLKTSTTLDSIDAIEILEGLQPLIKKKKTKRRLFRRKKKASLNENSL